MNTAIYAGTFDPFTYGHLDVTERAAKTFDQIILAVSLQTRKNVLFSTEERVALAQACVQHLKNVTVMPFSGLLVEWAQTQKVRTLIRGLRAFSDFEYEFQMALSNRKLAPQVETLFLMPSEEYSYVSSSMVKEIASLGSEVSDFVPQPVADALHQKYAACRLNG